MMVFITILLCLLTQRLANIGDLLKSEVFANYLHLLRVPLRKLTGWLGLSVALVPVLLVLSLLHYFTLGRLYGLAHLLLALAVLFLSVDMRDPKRVLASYLVAFDNNDSDMAAKVASDFFGEHLNTKNNSLSRAVSIALFSRCLVAIFVPLFWFVTLNIYGVAVYFVIRNLQQIALKVDHGYTGLVKAASQLQDILNWIPMRILALTFVLAGHFSSGFAHCYKKIVALFATEKDLVLGTGFAALDIKESDAKKSDSKENYAVFSLLDRSLLIWMVALALFNLGKIFT